MPPSAWTRSPGRWARSPADLRPAGAVVADQQAQPAGGGVSLDLDGRGTGALGSVGQRLGDDVVAGSGEQRQRWLPAMARLERIGAFGLTEPEVGSGASHGLATTARREGTPGAERTQEWIGSASFADLTGLSAFV